MKTVENTRAGDPEAARIGGRVRELRLGRRWSQAMLARELDLSQGRLSQIERGQGSLSAEQFLRVLKLFNVGVEAFDDAAYVDGSPVQNALARLGASHLAEARVLVPSALTDPLDVLVSVLLHPESPRHVAALAPVLVAQVDRVSLAEAAARLATFGRAARLGWLLEGLAAALAAEPPATEAALLRQRRRASTAIELFLQGGMLRPPEADAPIDLWDPEIRSVATAERVMAEAEALARKWRVATRIGVDELRSALRAARVGR